MLTALSASPGTVAAPYPMRSKQLLSKRIKSLSPLAIKRSHALSSLCWYINSLSQLSLPCQEPLHILSSQYWSSCSPLDITSLRLRKSVLSCVWRNLAAKVGHIHSFPTFTFSEDTVTLASPSLVSCLRSRDTALTRACPGSCVDCWCELFICPSSSDCCRRGSCNSRSTRMTGLSWNTGLTAPFPAEATPGLLAAASDVCLVLVLAFCRVLLGLWWKKKKKSPDNFSFQFNLYTVHLFVYLLFS